MQEIGQDHDQKERTGVVAMRSTAFSGVQDAGCTHPGKSCHPGQRLDRMVELDCHNHGSNGYAPMKEETAEAFQRIAILVDVRHTGLPRAATELGHVLIEGLRGQLQTLDGREVGEDRGSEVFVGHASLDRHRSRLDAVGSLWCKNMGSE